MPNELELNIPSSNMLLAVSTPQSAVYKPSAENSTHTPDSPKSISELATSISQLNIGVEIPTSPNHTPNPNPMPISLKPFTAHTKTFNPNPVIFPQGFFLIFPSDKDIKMTSAAESALQETRALQEINRANKNLANNINFTNLSKDGSNFIVWKNNASRAMKALLSIKDYWESAKPILTYNQPALPGPVT
ncbi:uncharacterized protein MELLADRAFT_104671 [Melampsora larici-populina 98AG31]|uniref:Uncharacterized protein n=1 Tax=Melampsora larici-populina (strain 98AG31 / pathotype 3-4-7) TaxID=747676 RepID=F4RFI5_MELLP|nr:uncharacterized protein MELLADRAFT_104671 [Melampsora larici-populina 98AG31]EGG08924.1 hypothetical protein MELLADRAFT_104671 [Melampsora larici-populina 98AG31]